jgi:hypothetical protein
MSTEALIVTRLHDDWEHRPMKHLCRLTLCLALLCGLPAIVAAQGWPPPGVQDPRARDKDDDRRDRIFGPRLPKIGYLPPGINEPGFSPYDRTPRNPPIFTDPSEASPFGRTPGMPRTGTGHQANGRSPFDGPRFPGTNVEPRDAGTVRLQTLETFRPPPISEAPRISPAFEHPISSPQIASGFHLRPSGVGRGFVGIVGGGFAAIAAIFGRIFGRRNECDK